MESEERKKQLRRSLQEKRDSLSPLRALTDSRLLCDHLDAIAFLRQAETIMGFLSIKNEVDLSSWLTEQFDQGKTIILPRVENDGHMVGVKYTGMENTKKSRWGIWEPFGEPFPADAIDAVLVPGLVFDRRGFRLGYGKGFYDRYLPHLRENAFKCGICFDFQIVEDVFPHEKDVAVDWIVTDKQVLPIKNRP